MKNKTTTTTPTIIAKSSDNDDLLIRVIYRFSLGQNMSEALEGSFKKCLK